jgi:hypothetical protein
MSYPKRIECAICCESKFIIPCRADNNCNIYTCKECWRKSKEYDCEFCLCPYGFRFEMVSELKYEEIGEAGEEFCHHLHMMKIIYQLYRFGYSEDRDVHLVRFTRREKAIYKIQQVYQLYHNLYNDTQVRGVECGSFGGGGDEGEGGRG